MERLGGEHRGQVSSVRQVAIASSIGTALEWYDYFLYGTAAALIFNQLFFPEADPLMGTLLAFATFGVPKLFGRGANAYANVVLPSAVTKRRSCVAA